MSVGKTEYSESPVEGRPQPGSIPQLAWKAEGGKDGDVRKNISAKELWKNLSFTDRYLAPMVLLAMILGVIIGNFASAGVARAFSGASWEGVSIPILIGLLVMIWPALSKVQWERLPEVFKQKQIWVHLCISFILNWLVAPFIMAAVAWATLPDAAVRRERRGVLLVGVARCIAMVLIWTGIAQGDGDYCAILVVFNSALQMVLFAPYSLFFVNIVGTSRRSNDPELELNYASVAKAVGIYLGLPLCAGAVTRFIVLKALSRKNQARFFAAFGPVAVVGLLYIIVVLFANQGERIINNIGNVFRVCVPLVLYFAIVWATTFFSFWKFSNSRWGDIAGGYDKAVTQAFTAGSNNFELAIAVAVASFGNDAPEVLAATLGPLIEVPVLLALSYVALYLRGRMNWSTHPQAQVHPAATGLV